MNNLLGYVVYGLNVGKRSAIGIVSENGEAQANAETYPDSLKSILVAIEDRRFFEHKGYDPIAIARAACRNIMAGCIKEGASTITQQVARALMRDQSRTITRKIREILRAIELEESHDKDSILNLYLSEVYFGRGNRGIRAASLAYFDKELEELDGDKLLFLVSLLKGPNGYLKSPEKISHRLSYYKKTLNVVEWEPPCAGSIDLSVIQERGRMFGPFRQKALSVLSPNIDHKKCSITTSINPELQRGLASWFAGLDERASIVVVKDGLIIASSSWCGPDHPLLFRSNVGSTLKPFIYVFLRRLGVSLGQKLDARSNWLGIPVREAMHFDEQISLDDALLHSNNNAFLNAASLVGMDCLLVELSKIIKQPLHSLSPASILGATPAGLTLGELTVAYDRFFSNPSDLYTMECVELLQTSAVKRLGEWARGFELKTGTTNDNRENFFIIGFPGGKLRLGLMREGGWRVPVFGKHGFAANLIRKTKELAHALDAYASNIV